MLGLMLMYKIKQALQLADSSIRSPVTRFTVQRLNDWPKSRLSWWFTAHLYVTNLSKKSSGRCNKAANHQAAAETGPRARRA